MSNCYTVGFAKVDITPDKPTPYLAFNPRHTLFEGVHDPLYARVITVSDSKEQAVIIGTDTIGIANAVLGEDRNYTSEVRKKIAEKTGIPETSVMLASPHIHSAPETINLRPIKDDANTVAWLEELQDKISDAVLKALNNTFQANMYVMTGSAEGISYNRRKDPILDTQVTVLLFKSVQEDRNVLLTQFACHPVMLQVQDQISADYLEAFHACLEKSVKNLEGDLFLQGACGDIDPVIGNTKNFNDTYYTGTALAGEVLKLYGRMSIAKSAVQPVIIKSKSKELLLPSRPLPKGKETEDFVATMDERIRAGQPLPPELKRKEELYYRLKMEDVAFRGEVQILRIGNALLTGIPGEPFCKLGLTIKSLASPCIGIPVGYANGYLGYIAPKEAWDKGGYEVNPGPWSIVGFEGYDMILDAAEDLLKEMKD